jgi:hypothetical protein
VLTHFCDRNLEYYARVGHYLKYQSTGDLEISTVCAGHGKS